MTQKQEVGPRLALISAISVVSFLWNSLSKQKSSFPLTGSSQQNFGRNVNTVIGKVLEIQNKEEKKNKSPWIYSQLDSLNNLLESRLRLFFWQKLFSLTVNRAAMICFLIPPQNFRPVNLILQAFDHQRDILWCYRSSLQASSWKEKDRNICFSSAAKQRNRIRSLREQPKVTSCFRVAAEEGKKSRL